jgi:hypothetical protein
VALALTVGPGERLGVMVGAVSCTQYSDCAPFVCVNNDCVACWNDDTQCDLQSQNYCDINSGDCTDGEECLPLGYPSGTGECEPCDASGNGICYAPHYWCDPEALGECRPII